MNSDDVHKKNFFKSLLNYSSKLSSQDGTRESKVTEEDKQWLKRMMDSQALDPGKVILEIRGDLEILPSNDSEAEHREELLEDLCDHIDQLDRARDFIVPMDGSSAMLAHLELHDFPNVQGKAAQVLSTCAQNLPNVQNALFIYKDGALVDLLIKLAFSKNIKLAFEEIVMCQAQCIHTLSSIYRNYTLALSEFVSVRNGISMILELMIFYLSISSSPQMKGHVVIMRKLVSLLYHTLNNTKMQQEEAGSNDDDIANALQEYFVIVGKSLSSTSNNNNGNSDTSLDQEGDSDTSLDQEGDILIDVVTKTLTSSKDLTTREVCFRMLVVILSSPIYSKACLEESRGSTEKVHVCVAQARERFLGLDKEDQDSFMDEMTLCDDINEKLASL